MSQNVHSTQAPQQSEPPPNNGAYKSLFGDIPPYALLLLGTISTVFGGGGAIVAEKVSPSKDAAVSVEIKVELQKLRSDIEFVQRLQTEAKQERLQQIGDLKKEMATKENMAAIQQQMSEMREDMRKLVNYERQRTMP